MARARAASRRILIVDDDDDLRGLAAHYFRKAGYEVLTAADGVEGLSAAQSSKPDLILLDLAMPRMMGYEVCQKVREMPGLAKTPIIISSSKSFPLDKKGAMDLGADLYMVKPYKLDELNERINELLGVLPLSRKDSNA